MSNYKLDKLPTWIAVSEKIKDAGLHELTSLEIFIYNQEPVENLDEAFRRQLLNLINEQRIEVAQLNNLNG